MTCHVAKPYVLKRQTYVLKRQTYVLKRKTYVLKPHAASLNANRNNCATHHGEAERILQETLAEIGVELLFLPVYSPDFNPVEEVFSKLKYLLKYTYHETVFHNIEYAIWCAVSDLTAADTYGYYRHTPYFNLN